MEAINKETLFPLFVFALPIGVALGPIYLETQK